MARSQRYGYGVIVTTFVLAFILAIVPFPAWLGWARPEWIALILIYWTIALPHRVGVLTGLVLGIFLDVVEGAVLGQNALSLAVVALLANTLYQRLRVYNLWQQASVVFLLVGINQLICYWVQTLQGVIMLWPIYLLPAFTSALLWPVTLHVLRALRRNYQVY